MSNKEKNLTLVLKALTFAAEKHRHQRQDDAAASPYINHPIALVNLLIEVGVTDSKVIRRRYCMTPWKIPTLLMQN